MTSDLSNPHGINTDAVYVHENGLKGRVEDWAEDPDGRVKVRIKDHWLFFSDLTTVDDQEENAEAS